MKKLHFGFSANVTLKVFVFFFGAQNYRKIFITLKTGGDENFYTNVLHSDNFFIPQKFDSTKN